MSIDKSQFKAAVLYDVGCDLEEQLESARAELHRTEGRAQFGKLVTEKLRGLQAHLQKDVEEERLSPEDAAVRSKQIQTTINLVSHLAEGAVAELLKEQGRIDQSHRAIQLVKAKHDQEVAGLQAAKDALALEQAVGPMRSLRNADRPTGVHPGASLKLRRHREDEAEPIDPSPAPPKKKARRPRNKKKTNSEAQAP